MRFVKIAAAGILATAASAAPQATSSVVLDSTVSVVGHPTSIIEPGTRIDVEVEAKVEAKAFASAITLPDHVIKQAEAYANTDAQKAIAVMKATNSGFTHIGDDGIVRSYTSTGQVIDALPLTNAQLLTLIATLPVQLKPYTSHLYETYTNISGHTVPQAQWYNPPAHIKPREFSSLPPAKLDAKLDAEAAALVAENNIRSAKEIDSLLKSANPAMLAVKAVMNNPACLGRGCRTRSDCQSQGCLSCQDFDLILLSQRVCMGVMP